MTQPFSYCLNTSTILGGVLSIVDSIHIAAEAGYDGVEPWLIEIDAWVEQGGTPEQLREVAVDRGLKIFNLIAFFDWPVPEPERRRAAFLEAERCFRLAQQLGSPHVAAPPFGVEDRHVDLQHVAVQFTQLMELGSRYGVTPLLEFWGHSATLTSLDDALNVSEAIDGQVRVLADVYHIYKGQGDFSSLERVSQGTLGLIHVNDYPDEPHRADIQDSDRVYPGDGVAPWSEIMPILHQIAPNATLSLELFNPHYWSQEPLQVAQTGLEKLKRVVESNT